MSDETTDWLGQPHDDGTPDPVRAARGHAKPALPRRFYTEAGFSEGPDGFRLTLDGRPANTPARNPLRLPTRALAERVAAGRFLVASDVWPTEPLPADSPFRSLEGVVLSAHRAGGIPAAFREIGDMVLDDLRLLARGLAPVRMQQAAPELVGRYRNRPAG